jgi:aspartate/methionine/tyrosine aminotransferase
MAGKIHFDGDLNASRYTDTVGIPQTRERIAKALNSHKALDGEMEISPEMVIYSPHGIKGLLSTVIPTAFFDHATNNRPVLLFFLSPGYGVITSTMNNNGVKVITVPMKRILDDWEIPWGTIKKEINNCFDPTGFYKPISFMYYNFPHNPTGATRSYKQMTGDLIYAGNMDLKLIVDEAYDHLRYDESKSMLQIPGWQNSAIILQSVSKGWNATGLRFAWSVSHLDVTKLFEKVWDVKDSGSWGVTIATGLSCLEDINFAKETNERYKNLHAILCEGLIQSGFKTGLPNGGLCLFSPAPKSAGGINFRNVIECAQYFREKLRISLMHYEVDGAWYLRWAVTFRSMPEYGLPSQEDVIREAMRRLGEIKFEF